MFADPDVANGEVEFAGDGDGDAAFGGAIEFGEDDAGDAAGFGKFAGLFEAVLAGGGIEDEENFVGGIGDDAGGGAAHLFEFGHEVFFVMEAAGGIDDDEVGFAGAAGLEGVEDDGAGVGSLGLLDEFGVGAGGPDFELFDSGGAEGIGGGHEDGLSFVVEAAGEFAGGGGFAGPVDADHHNDEGRGVNAGEGPFGGGEDFEEMGPNEAANFAGVADEFPVDALANGFEDFGGGADPDVGGDEGVFEFVEQVGIDFLLAEDDILNLVYESGAGFFDPGFEAIEEVPASFAGTEKRRKHWSLHDTGFRREFRVRIVQSLWNSLLLPKKLAVMSYSKSWDAALWALFIRPKIRPLGERWR